MVVVGGCWRWSAVVRGGWRRLAVGWGWWGLAVLRSAPRRLASVGGWLGLVGVGGTPQCSAAVGVGWRLVGVGGCWRWWTGGGCSLPGPVRRCACVRLEAHPRCCVDFAHRVGHMQYQRAQRDRPRVRAFFERFQDQLVYGTDLMIFEGDAPAQTQRACHATWRAHFRWFATDEAMEVPEVDGAVRGIALAGPVLRKLYCGNAMRFFRGL